MKKALINIGMGILVLLATILFLTGVVFLVWNTAAVWLVPSFEYMGILTAAGIGTLFAIINNVAQYWTNKYIEIKRLKTLETLNIVNSLNRELAFIKTVLYEKGVMTDIDLIATEVVRDAK